MKKIITYLPTMLVAGIILYLSLLREPNFKLPDIHHADKYAHFLMYFGFSFCFIWDLFRDHKISFFHRLFSIVLPILWGGIIEILQEKFFYPRTGDWKDWLADIIGAIIGYSIFIIVCKLIHK